MRVLPISLLLLLAACRSSRSSSGGSNGEVIEVVNLQHAAAADIAGELNRLAAPGLGAAPETEPRFTLVADPRTNSLIVKSSSGDFEHVLALVGKLDQKVDEKKH